MSATVAAKAKLTLGSNTASFADADPDVTPLLSAAAITVDVRTRTAAASNVTRSAPWRASRASSV